MQINLKIWRQENPESAGKLEEYTVADAHPSMSFIELLDVLNEHISQLRKFKSALEKENLAYLNELMENANKIKRIIKYFHIIFLIFKYY